MVQLGEGMKTTTVRSRDELVVRGDLAAEVAAQLSPEINRLEQLLQRLTRDQKPPQVSVAAPNVTVKNDVPSAEIDLTVSGMEQLASQVGALRSDMAAFMAALMRPTVREVHRDGNGRITQIIDRRT